jgi:tetratricopeptide (TPR) repeat protein
MKKIQIACAGLLSLLSFTAIAQTGTLTEAWRDPQFVKSFTGSFLPLTEQEPRITEKEAELFQELSTLLGEGRNEEAINRLAAAVRAATAAAPASAALNYTLGNLYLQNARFNEAVEQYRAAIQKFPSFRRAYKNLGLALIQSGQHAESIPVLVKSIEMGDAAGDTFGLLAFSYLNQGNPTAALEGYRQASLLNPGNREWMIGKAEALMRSERYDEAIATFKQLIIELPDRDAFYTSISNAYLALGDSSQAAYYLEILRRRGTARSTALGLLGDIYVNEGLPRLAVTAYNDALQRGDFSSTRSIRSLRALLQRGYFTEAESFLASLEGLQSLNFSENENREILNLKAQLALALGDNEEAAEILLQVLEEDPMNGNALMLLGNYNQGKGDLETAIFYYERASSLVDFQREAQLQLARIYVQQKDYLPAIRQLEAALQLQYSANVQDFLDAVRSVYNRSL